MIASKRKLTLGALLALAICAVAGWLWFKTTAAGVSVSDIDGYGIAGVDISAHNGRIDFGRLREQGISFAIIKATEGIAINDRNFHDNYRMAREAGLKVGAYHFFRFECSGEMQAINLLNSMRGKEFDLPAIIDVEEWTNPANELTDSIVNRVREMASYLKARGLRVMVYSNRDGYDRFLSHEFSDCLLWICSLRGTPPEHKWDFWQYTHRGRLDGVDSRVDINVFNGDSAGWKVFTDSCRLTIR